MPVSDWTPIPADIAALLRARTYDGSGDQSGFFSSSTRPTDVQVAELIALAVGELSGRIGEVPEPLVAMARNVVTFRVAALVELSYVPEQTDDGTGTVVGAYSRLYDSAVQTLAAAAQAIALAEVAAAPDQP